MRPRDTVRLPPAIDADNACCGPRGDDSSRTTVRFLLVTDACSASDPWQENTNHHIVRLVREPGARCDLSSRKGPL